MKKYELIKDRSGHFRIKAIRTFSAAKKGMLGGLVDSEDNLSHDGSCWIDKDARVLNTASVSGDARICGKATVSDCASIRDNAVIGGEAWIRDGALVCEHARVRGNAHVCGGSVVSGYASIYQRAYVYGKAIVEGFACVYGSAAVGGNAKVFGRANIDEHAEVSGDAEVSGPVRLRGSSRVTTGKFDGYFFLHIMGSQHPITYNTRKAVWIGCHCLSIKAWLRSYRKRGEANGYTDERIKEYAYYLKLIDEMTKGFPRGK